MFKLKDYQNKSIREFESFLDQTMDLSKISSISVPHEMAFMNMKKEKYDNTVGVPFVCIKIPTGGGKTVVGCHMLNSIYSKYLINRNEKGLVLWLVPTDVIRTQTLNAFKDSHHDYREALDLKFSNNVKIFNFKESMSITKSDLENNLCIIVATVSAFRINDLTKRHAYRGSGKLFPHFQNISTEGLKKDKNGLVANSLINVIRLSKPVIIVDEGHNVKTDLAKVMFKDLNPSFVLEYTGTPRTNKTLPSNILVDISAAELQKEHMVKIPINLTNVTPWTETIRRGVDKCKELGRIAKKEHGEYIRPIVLIQAENDASIKGKIHVEKIKEFLKTRCNIKEKEIAIRTGTIDDISKINLYSNKCPIKYIITVKALQEGWDNTFAYVLISVTNLGAKIAVHQIIGRILRLPQVKEKKNKELNESYVFTSSKSFEEAAESLVKGLKSNGFDERHYKFSTDKTIVDDSFKRLFSDKSIKIPYITIKGTKKTISYYGDLIPPDFDLSKQEVSDDFNYINDQNIVQKYEYKEGSTLVPVEKQKQLDVILDNKDFSKEQLVNWLDQRIRRNRYEQEEKRKYIGRFIDSILNSTKFNLSDLSVNSYKLKNQINDKISEIELKKSKKVFNQLEKAKKISLSEKFHEFPNKMELDTAKNAPFQNHLYEKSGPLNSEERKFISRVAALKNIEWWYRNVEIKDFYLQGWANKKFFPDFIIKTKKGKFYLAEYKGGHLISNEDTKYKMELGKKWAELAGKNYGFWLGGQNDQMDLDKFLIDLQKN